MIIGQKVVFNNSKIVELRKAYEHYLQNSPFKKTLQLTEEQRIALGIPPNKYYEREWELTMNPATGRPEPNKVLELQKKLHNKSYASRVPGDAVSNNWIERGPNNIGGRTRVVLFDPNDATNKRVYVGGVSGGLWVNQDITNVNSAWTLVSGVPSNMNISCITVDPRDSNIWYIGTGEQYTFGAAVGNGVYKTTDGGINWTHVTIQLAGGATIGTDFAGIYYINDIIAWNNTISNSTEVFIGVGTHIYGDATSPTNWLGYQTAGLYKSLDNGLNWSRLESSNLKLSASSSYYTIPNDFEIDASNRLWIGTISTYGSGGLGGGKVFNSIDGATWTQITTLTNSDRVELAVSSTNANKIYALTQGTTATGPHIFSTIDGFSTVNELAKPNDADTNIPSNDFTNGQDFYDLVIEVDPTDDQIIYVGGIDLFRSISGVNTNTASKWQQISKWSESPNLNTLTCSIVHADQHALTFRPGVSGENEAVIGCDGGVYYASSLSTAQSSDVFTVMNTNYNVTQFYYGGYGQSTANELIVAGAQDNGTQFINGATAGINSSDFIRGGDGAYSTIDKDGSYMIDSYLYSNHKYVNLPYSGISYDIDTNNNEGDFISPAGLDHNLNIMYSNGVLRDANGNIITRQINRYILGTSSAIKSQLSNVLLDGSPTAFKVSPYTTTSTTLLVGTDNGRLLKLTNANVTPTWADISGVSFLGSISDIEFGVSENDIFLTFHNYGVASIWYSPDGGVTWENKEGNLPDMPVKCILQNPLLNNEVIIGTELGVWSTTNFNTSSPTWLSSINGMSDVKVVDLDLRTADNSILATTFGRGLFTGKFTNKAFSFSIANSIVNVCKPNDGVFNLNFNTLSSYNTLTSFSATGIPSGASVTFSPTSLSTEGTFSMTVSNIGSLAIGEYPITITGTGNETNSIDVILKVLDSSFGILTPTAPLNNATGVEISNTLFTWNKDLNATSYDFDLAEDPGFNTILKTTNVTTNSYTSTLILNRAKVYYWRIRSKNDCNTSNYSATQKFQTQIDCMEAINATTVQIPDGLGANSPGTQSTSIINIPDNFTVTDVNVTMNISHTWIGDLVISLISPDNTEIILFNRGCNNGRVQEINVTYDDAASTAISCSSSLSGTYIPDSPLSGFNGKNSLGDWTLKAVDYYNGDVGTINNWSLNICQAATVTNSTLINNTMNVGTNSTYVIKQTDVEASSTGSTATQQKFMVIEIPQKGIIKLSGVNLIVGDTFTQDDINTNKVAYSNTSSTSTTDFFKADITNATGGFLPAQQITFNIDAALAVDDEFFNKTGISVFPTVSEGNFFVQSKSFIGKTALELYNISGQRVYKTNLDFNSYGLKQIKATDLSSGIYILKISSGNMQGSKKIIIK